MSEERERLLDYRSGLTPGQQAHLDYVRAHPPREPSPAERLEELELDRNAGRTAKWDVRCAPDEKVAWSEAARLLGVSQSEWARDVLNAAARVALRQTVGAGG